MGREETVIDAGGREVRVSSPSKVYFPPHDGAPAVTKLDVVRYYQAVAEVALRGLRERPTTLKRWVDGIAGESFFQKRLPATAPDWLQKAVVTFPSGRTATELVCTEPAHLAWANNLGVIDFNPWPVRRPDLDHPDELRVDLDPSPDVGWPEVRRAALLAREVLEEHGLTGWPKTSGSRGIHILVRIAPEWDFPTVRRAALALAREMERRAPGLATSAWWKEERRGVFVDYNQNARDRTLASAYSVRATPEATVCCPVTWDEVPHVEIGDLRVATVPDRLARVGDPSAGIDGAVGRLDALLALATRDEEQGLGDAPWPPHFRKARGEGRRVQPSRARKPPGADQASS